MKIFFYIAVEFLLVFVGRWAGAESYLEIKECRPPEEEGEFLQTCVKATVGRRAGKILGPGQIAVGGRAAAVLIHRSYGNLTDRIKVKVYGLEGQLELSLPMGTGGEEFPLEWSKVSERFLAWIEVDGRGGTLKVVDRKRKRIVISARSPWETWDVFSPYGLYIMIPIAGPRDDPTSAQVNKVEVINLISKERKMVLSVGEDESIQQLRWSGANRVSATVIKAEAKQGKTVQGSF